MANRFRKKSEGKAFVEREIVNDGKVVGHVRLSPSGVKWKPRGSHRWHRVSLDPFASWMEANGTLQKK